MGAGEIERLGRGDASNQSIGDIGRGDDGRRMPGAVETRSQWISSETRIKSCSLQKVASARISSADQTVPPGLCGLQKNTTWCAASAPRERVEVHHVAALTLDQLRIEDARSLARMILRKA